MENNVKKVRLEWIDAMRGFTMMLVVAYHVAQIGFGENEKTSVSLPFLVMFRMPLFFFVSGFLAWKSRWVWTALNFCQMSLKKIRVQLVPTLVFMTVFIVFKGRHTFMESLENMMSSPYKGGYWFTWVLLLMLLIYYVIAFLEQKLHLKHWLIMGFFLLAVFANLTLYMPHTFGNWWKAEWMNVSSLVQVMRYMQFFLLGNIVHRFWKESEGLMRSVWFFPTVLTVAIVSCAEFFRWHSLSGQWINLPKMAATYSLLMLVIMFFHHYEHWFVKTTKVGTVLQYIGTRTLDIYLLHFLFIPKLPMVGKWLNANQPNFVVDVVCSLSVAGVVVCFCLLVSNILRVSPLLRKYLFGR